MLKKARINMSGALHHLIIRGIERKRIYRNDQDRNNFLDRLGMILVESKTACYAWALLSNQVRELGMRCVFQREEGSTCPKKKDLIFRESRFLYFYGHPYLPLILPKYGSP